MGNPSGYLTLTTDWNQSDFYTGVLKGQLVSSCPKLNIIDISHDVPSFNTHHAAFIVRQSFKHYPPNTIHLVMVNMESGTKPHILYLYHNEHHFIVPDNGIISLMFSSPPESVFQVALGASGSFASVSCIVKILNGICNGLKPNEIGTASLNFEEMVALRATIDDNIINGNVIYIDSYRNAISNLSRSLFERVGQGRPYDIYVQSNFNHLSKLSKTYNEVEQGELLALFNSADLLEVAIRNGYAADLLNLSIGSGVRVKFR